MVEKLIGNKAFTARCADSVFCYGRLYVWFRYMLIICRFGWWLDVLSIEDSPAHVVELEHYFGVPKSCLFTHCVEAFDCGISHLTTWLLASPVHQSAGCCLVLEL